MDNVDNYDLATLKLEQANSLNVALSALNDGGTELNREDCSVLNSLAGDLVKEAREMLLKLTLE